MSIQDSVYRSAVPEDKEARADGQAKEIIYRVILDGIKSDIETPGSFAIKYGILTSKPVTRIQFMLRSLPNTILETKSVPRARSALELIEEAGGVGHIEEYNPEEKPTIEIPEEEPTIEKIEEEPTTAKVENKNCLKCGFPLKKDDEYCQFCHTPLVEKKKSPNIKSVIEAGKSGTLLTPKKILIYVLVVVVILLLGLLTR